MTNKFEKAYEEYKTFDQAFHEAEERMDEVGIEKARTAYKAWKARYHKEGSVFAFIYCEYEESRNNGNEDLNFYNYIDKTESCIAFLKENGVKRFTFSSGWTGTIGNAWELQKAGCRMVGMKEVKGKTNSWSGKQEILPALVFEISNE